MDGTIEFTNLEELAEFLKAFTGSTSKFTVRKVSMNTWVLEFTGGF